MPDERSVIGMVHVEMDAIADALYVHVTDRPVARTETLDTGTLVDVDSEGQVVGIEVLNASRPFPLAQILARYSLDEVDRRVLAAMFTRGEPGASVLAFPPQDAARVRSDHMVACGN